MSLTPVVHDLTEALFAVPTAVDEITASFSRTVATPPAIAELRDISIKLLRTCVVHYEFAAIGQEKSLQAVELAVRHRLNDFDQRYFDLIKKLRQDETLSSSVVEVIDAARKIRNTFAHPRAVAALPLVLVVDSIRTSHLVISLLFPDVSDETVLGIEPSP